MRGGVPRTASLAGVAGVALAALVGSAAPTGRIYGYDNIKRHLQRQKRTWGASGSLAGQPHEHKREIARRLRQQARDAERQRARQVAKNGPDSPFPGISRRGNFVTWPNGQSAKAR